MCASMRTPISCSYCYQSRLHYRGYVRKPNMALSQWSSNSLSLKPRGRKSRFGVTKESSSCSTISMLAFILKVTLHGTEQLLELQLSHLLRGKKEGQKDQNNITPDDPAPFKRLLRSSYNDVSLSRTSSHNRTGMPISTGATKLNRYECRHPK